MLQSRLRAPNRRTNSAVAGVRDVRQFAASFNRRTNLTPGIAPAVAEAMYFYNGGIDR